MPWPEVLLEDWGHFTTFANNLEAARAGWRGYFICRGQSNAKWPLAPSLLRRLPKGVDRRDAGRIEAIALIEFQAQAHLHVSQGDIPHRQDIPSWWALMQHHHAPTRLLDWTASPYVAAYFAVSSGFENDAAVWVFHPHPLSAAMRQFGEADIGKVPADSYGDLFYTEQPSSRLFVFDRKTKSQRMVAQQGLFTLTADILADHGEITGTHCMVDSDTTAACKWIIPAAQKVRFLKHLRAMNVTANSLFPGVDGLGRSIEELVTVESASLVEEA